MPRDGSGNYTLPAGNPVSSDTTIESTWANSTMDDLAAALTDSLSRSGQGGMLVPLTFSDGTEALPGIAWANELGTGFRRAASGDMRGVILGNDQIRLLAGGNLQVSLDNGATWRDIAKLDAGGGLTLTGALNGTSANFSGVMTSAGANMSNGRILSVGNAVAGTDALNQTTGDVRYVQSSKLTNFLSVARFTLNGGSSPTVTESTGRVTTITMNTTSDVGSINLSGVSGAGNLVPVFSARSTLFPPSSGTTVSFEVSWEVISASRIDFKCLNNNETSFDNSVEVTMHLVDTGA